MKVETTEKRRVRYAVVGLGNIAQVAVLPAFEHAEENSELVALVSSDPEKLDALSGRYRIDVTGSYDDLERVLEQGSVDAVYVAVPNHLHRTIAERVARAGVHVLCEKPMAVTEEDCEAMISAARETGVKLMIAYRLHFEEANLEAIERLNGGKIGEPRIFSSVFAHQVRDGDIRTREELGGGALFDVGVYCVNAARYVFRDEPIEVWAEQIVGADRRSKDVDDTTAAILRFPGNRIAQFVASQGAANVSEFRVVGTKGEIRLESGYEYTRKIRETIVQTGVERTKTFPREDQFAPELVHFSRCILEDAEPEPSGLEGLADVRIMEALIRSAKTGQRVKLTAVPVPRRPDASLLMKKPPVQRVDPVNAPGPSK